MSEEIADHQKQVDDVASAGQDIMKHASGILLFIFLNNQKILALPYAIKQDRLSCILLFDGWYYCNFNNLYYFARIDKSFKLSGKP